MTPWSRMDTLTTRACREWIKKKGYNDYFGFHLYTSGVKNYFLFLSTDDSLVVLDLDSDRHVKTVDFTPISQKTVLFNGLFHRDTLHIVDAGRKQYRSYAISSNWEFSGIDSIDLLQLTGLRHFELPLNLRGHGLAYAAPFLAIQYLNTGKKNYLDGSSYLEINTRDKSFQKTGKYPDCFHCTYIYDYESSSVYAGNGALLTVYNQYDHIYLNQKGEDQAGFPLQHDCKFRPFDAHKEQDLSYIRKYGVNGERNLKIIEAGDQHYIVLKHNNKDRLSDSSRFSWFVFDNRFKQLYGADVQESIFFPAFFSYKNGFLVFSDSLNKAFYYVF